VTDTLNLTSLTALHVVGLLGYKQLSFNQPTIESINTMKINKSNVSELTYYNLLQLCRITDYANPIAGITATGEAWECKTDGLGNILSGSKA
jgi:hypothetical protein